MALEEVGELPVGFNRGPWFGKMLKPAEKALRFATPSFTAGTKGIQRGPVVILKADPFSIPGRAQGGQPVPKDVVEKKRAAVQAAIAEVNANKAAFKGAWVLIPGASSGFARDGRRGSKLPDGSPEYLDAAMMPPLTKALVEAGALGTIQSATPPSAIQPDRNSEPPLSILDGFVASWDTLPVLPDIKLLNTQFSEIKALVEKGEPVVLEFDIRNWFTMGPIKYHNVVATLRGTTYPDEFIVIGGHFDAFTGGTGGVDDGSGFAPGMEAIRLIAASGAKPKRSIVFIAFAAEEQGLVGSQAWLKKHPELHGKIVMMINRDGSPSAITGATVPETLVRRLPEDHRAARDAPPQVALRAHADRAAGPRDEPRRHRLIVIRDAGHPDAQLRDDGRADGPGREGDPLVPLSLRLAHDQRPLQRTGALHGAPAALGAGDGGGGVWRGEPRQAAHPRRRLPGRRHLRDADDRVRGRTPGRS